MGYPRQEYCSELPFPPPGELPVLAAFVQFSSITQSCPGTNPCLAAFVQFSSITQSCPTLCDPMSRSTPGLPVHHQLPESMSIEWVMPSNHLILCRPLLLMPPIPPSIRVFSNKSTLHMRWPKYWSFSFSVSPCNEHPGLISFRMDWLDLLAVQGTLKSLLQHHSSKASVLRRSAFFIVQLSHPYMTTGKTIVSGRFFTTGATWEAQPGASTAAKSPRPVSLFQKLTLYTEGRERPRKEAATPAGEEAGVTSQELTHEVGLGHHTSRASLCPPARIFQVTAALTGFSHIHRPDDPNTLLSLKAVPLKLAPLWGHGRKVHPKDRGRQEGVAVLRSTCEEAGSTELRRLV